MKRHTLQVGSFEVNCTFLVKNDRALIVDPGQEAARLLETLRTHGWTPEAILLTHGHFDHIGGIPGLQQEFPDLPVYVSAADAKILSHPLNRLPPDYPPIVARNQKRAADAAKLDWRIEVLETPGHTPGGVCYFLPAEKLLLSGDTLFAGSVGRTDLPGGDMATLMTSIEKLKTLPDETLVIPGHGMTTTIAEEKAGNPFLN